MPPPHPEVPALPGSSPSPCQSARKRGRPSRFESDSECRPKLSPGRPRVAHPDCTPLPSQADEEALVTSPSVQIIGDSPTVSPAGRKRGRPKGVRSNTSKHPVLLSGSPSEAGALTHFRAAGAAGRSSLGSPEPRKRGRPKGSRNAPVGERFLCPARPSCPFLLALLSLIQSSDYFSWPLDAHGNTKTSASSWLVKAKAAAGSYLDKGGNACMQRA